MWKINGWSYFEWTSEAYASICRPSEWQYLKCFSPSKYKIPFPDWIDSKRDLVLGENTLDEVDKLCWFSSCTPPGCEVIYISFGMTSRTQKARSVFTNLRHLWRRSGGAIIDQILSMDWRGTWPLWTEDNLWLSSVLKPESTLARPWNLAVLFHGLSLLHRFLWVYWSDFW